jgi:hypothetical protein
MYKLIRIICNLSKIKLQKRSNLSEKLKKYLKIPNMHII